MQERERRSTGGKGYRMDTVHKSMTIQSEIRAWLELNTLGHLKQAEKLFAVFEMSLCLFETFSPPYPMSTLVLPRPQGTLVPGWHQNYANLAWVLWGQAGA